jgi:hypothetical protein
MEESKLKKHVTLVGAIQISFSILGLIGAFVVFFALSFARGQVGDDETARMALGILSGILPLVLGSLSVLGMVGGIGLLAYKPWARYILIIVSALDCLAMPFGTIYGVYALWVLLKDDTVKLFSKG